MMNPAEGESPTPSTNVPPSSPKKANKRQYKRRNKKKGTNNDNTTDTNDTTQGKTASPTRVWRKKTASETQNTKPKEKEQVNADRPFFKFQWQYKSAGIVGYNWFSPNKEEKPKPLVLMVREIRNEKSGLCFPGGKIETIDNKNPIETALREFNEETFGMFKDDIPQLKSIALREFPKNCFYWSGGKYYTFFIPIPYYNEKIKELNERGLSWIDLNSLAIAKEGEETTTPELHTFTTTIVNRFPFQYLLNKVLSNQQHKEADISASSAELLNKSLNLKPAFKFATDEEIHCALKTKDAKELVSVLLQYSEGGVNELILLLQTAVESLQQQNK